MAGPTDDFLARHPLTEEEPTLAPAPPAPATPPTNLAGAPGPAPVAAPPALTREPAPQDDFLARHRPAIAEEDRLATRFTAWRAANTDIKPERAVDVLRLTAATGFDPELVNEQYDDLKKEFEAKQLDDALIGSPALRSVMSDAARAAALKHDIANANLLEWLIAGKWKSRTIKVPLMGGLTTLELPGIPERVTPSAIEVAFMDGLREREFNHRSAAAWAGNESPENLARIEELRTAQQSGPREYGANNLLTRALLGAPRNVAELLEEAGATIAGTAAGAKLATVTAGPEAAPVGGAVGGYVAGATFDFFDNVGAVYWDLREMKDEKGNRVIDDETARYYAFAASAAGAAVTGGLMLRAAKMVPGVENVINRLVRREVGEALEHAAFRHEARRFVKDWGEGTVTGGAMMAVQAGINAAAEEAALARAEGRPVDVNRVMDATVQGFKDGLVEMSVLAAWGPGHAYLQRRGLAELAAAEHARLSAISETGVASQILQKHPELGEEVARAAAREAGAVTHAYADSGIWTKVWQERGVDPAKAAQEIVGDDGKAWLEAQDSGRLAIPIDRWLSKVAQTDLVTSLAQDVALTPDGPTPRQEAERQKMLEKLAALKKEGGDPHEEQLAAVEAEYYRQFIAAKRSDKNARDLAKIVRDAVDALAKDKGWTPQRVLEMYPLVVKPRTGEVARPVIPSQRPRPRISSVLDGLSHAAKQEALVAVQGARTPEAARATLGLVEGKWVDELTTAGNKRAYQDFRARPRAGAHVMIDLDSLTDVNEVSHEEGDAALRAVGRTLHEVARGLGGKFFRFGGDELAAHFDTRAAAEEFQARATEAMKALAPIAGGAHKLSVSLGFGPTPEAADAALLVAKQESLAAGRGGNEGKIRKRLGAIEVALATQPTPELQAEKAALEQKLATLVEARKHPDLSRDAFAAWHEEPIRDVVRKAKSDVDEQLARVLEVVAPHDVRDHVAAAARELGPGAAQGFVRDGENGQPVFDVDEAAKGLVDDETTKLHQGIEEPADGRFLRGRKGKKDPAQLAHRVVARTLAAIPKVLGAGGKPEVYSGDAQWKSIEEALAWAEAAKPLEPLVNSEDRQDLRWRRGETGHPKAVGNEKMAWPNDTYPRGRNTWDDFGCGRRPWAELNGLDEILSCYGGKCYADAIAKNRAGREADVTGGVRPVGLQKSDARRKQAEEAYRKGGIEAVRKKFPDLIVTELSPEVRAARKAAGRPDAKFSLKVIPNGPQPAIVYTNLQPANGQDIRLGVDTDGGAWIAKPEVLDAMLAANPRIVSVYTSGYYAAPPPHALAGRAIINVTVSGWHPVGETLARLRYAEQARANGWNVILREVTADPETFGKEKASVYNRIHEALLATDFFLMQQPLHAGRVHGKELWGLPGCCIGSPKNPHKCDQCEVTEGLGDRFQAFWGIAEDGRPTEKVLPDVKDYRALQAADLRRGKRGRLGDIKGTLEYSGPLAEDGRPPATPLVALGTGTTKLHQGELPPRDGGRIEVIEKDGWIQVKRTQYGVTSVILNGQLDAPHSRRAGVTPEMARREAYRIALHEKLKALQQDEQARGGVGPLSWRDMEFPDPEAPDFIERAKEALARPDPRLAQQPLEALHPRQAWEAIEAGADPAQLSDDAILGLLAWNDPNGEWDAIRAGPRQQEELRQALAALAKDAGVAQMTVADLAEIADTEDYPAHVRRRASELEEGLVRDVAYFQNEHGGKLPPRGELLEALQREVEANRPLTEEEAKQAEELLPRIGAKEKPSTVAERRERPATDTARRVYVAVNEELIKRQIAIHPPSNIIDLVSEDSDWRKLFNASHYEIEVAGETRGEKRRGDTYGVYLRGRPLARGALESASIQMRRKGEKLEVTVFGVNNPDQLHALEASDPKMLREGFRAMASAAWTLADELGLTLTLPAPEERYDPAGAPLKMQRSVQRAQYFQLMLRGFLEEARAAQAEYQKRPDATVTRLYQGEGKPPALPEWMSPLMASVLAAPRRRGNGEAWLATVKRGQGVKGEELEWTGLEAFLRSTPGEITKDQILEHLALNKVELQRRVLRSGGEGGDRRTLRWQEARSSLEQAGWNMREGENEAEFSPDPAGAPNARWFTLEQLQNDPAAEAAHREMIAEMVGKGADPQEVEFDRATDLDWMRQYNENYNFRAAPDDEARAENLRQRTRIVSELEARGVTVESGGGPDDAVTFTVKLKDPYGGEPIVIEGQGSEDLDQKLEDEWDREDDTTPAITEDEARDIADWAKAYEEWHYESLNTDAFWEEVGAPDTAEPGSYQERLFYAKKGGKAIAGEFEAHTFGSNAKGLLFWSLVYDHEVGGEVVPVLSEAQSDLHQRGREHGYGTTDITERRDAVAKMLGDWFAAHPFRIEQDARNNSWTPVDFTGAVPEVALEYRQDGRKWPRWFSSHAEAEAFIRSLTPDQQELFRFKTVPTMKTANPRGLELLGVPSEITTAYSEYIAFERNAFARVPDAPWKGTGWETILVRDFLRMAAQRGMARVAWSKGSALNERYGDHAGGYTAAYDERIRYIVEKLVKPFGGKIEEGHLDGVEGARGDVWVATLPPAAQEHFRSAPQPLFQGSRGYLEFKIPDGPEEPVRMDMSLLEEANESTAAHEIGHWLSLVLGQVANRKDATEKHRQLYKTALEWMEYPSHDARLAALREREALIARRDAGGILSTEEQARLADITAKEERFSHGFEQYLSEGKSPSASLRTVFARFSEWMRKIYRAWSGVEDMYQRQYGRELKMSDEVRRMFDRLLVSEEAAAEAEEELGGAFSVGLPDLTEAEKRQEDAARAAEREETEQKIQTALAREDARAKSELMADERERIRAEVEAELDRTPVYRALKFLRGEVPEGMNPALLTPEGKPRLLDRAELIARYDAGFVRSLPPRITQREGGAPADLVAEAFGFATGDDLVKEFQKAPSRSRFVEGEVQRRMEEQFGPPLLTDPQRTAEVAMDAAHGPRRRQSILVGMRILARRLAPELNPRFRAIDMAALEARAEETVLSQRIADSTARQYLRSERAAARRALELAAAGRIAAAYDAREEQLWNHLLYEVAKEREEAARKGQEYLARFTTEKERAKLGRVEGGYLERVDDILGSLELRNVSMAQVQRRGEVLQATGGKGPAAAAMLAWMEEQKAIHRDAVIPPRLLENLDRTRHWRDLTHAELQEAVDAVKNIAHLAHTKDTLLAAKDRRERLAVLKEFHDRAIETYGMDPTIVDRNTLAFKKRAIRLVKKAEAGIIKPEELLLALDGGREDGPFHKYLYQPIADAYGRWQALAEKVQKPLLDELAKLPMELKLKLKRHRFTVNGQPYSLEAAIAVALNWGNLSNREKTVLGWTNTAALERQGVRPWQGEKTAEEFLRQLDPHPELWALVQKVWDQLETMREPAFDLEERMTGLRPTAVEPAAFVRTGPDGQKIEMRGGYYPMVYDRRFSSGGARQAEADDLRSFALFQPGYERSITPHGHLQARIENYHRPVELSLTALYRHLSHATKDIEMREALISVHDILTDQRFRDTVQVTVGEDALRVLDKWVKDVANDLVIPDGGEGLWVSIVNGTRRGLTASVFTYNAAQALQNLAGVGNVLAQVDAKYLWKGIQTMAANRGATVEWVKRMSSEMSIRTKHFDRDVKENLQILLGKRGSLARAKEIGLWALQATDMTVAYPTWIAAYHMALDGKVEGVEATTEAAVRHADMIVRRTLGSGATKDLPSLMRSPYGKWFTLFYGFANAQLNQTIAAGKQANVLWNDGQKYAALRRLTRVYFAIVSGYVLAELLTGRGPSDYDDDDKVSGADWAKWVALRATLAPGTLVPLVSGVLRSVEQGRDVSLAPYERVFTAVAQAGGATLDVGKAVIEGDDVEQELLDWSGKMAEAGGLVAGAPVAQGRASLGYLKALLEKEETPESVWEAMMGLTYGKKREGKLASALFGED